MNITQLPDSKLVISVMRTIQYLVNVNTPACELARAIALARDWPARFCLPSSLDSETDLWKREFHERARLQGSEGTWKFRSRCCSVRNSTLSARCRDRFSTARINIPSCIHILCSRLAPDFKDQSFFPVAALRVSIQACFYRVVQMRKSDLTFAQLSPTSIIKW
jgi:hypothetical protein